METFVAFCNELITMIATFLASEPIIYFVYMLLFVLVVRIFMILLSLGKGGRVK